MPEIARFLGILIAMYWSDHAPPHIHAYYNEHEVLVAIEDGSIIGGAFPRRQLKILQNWCKEHRVELMVNWDLARARQTLRKIK